MSDIREKKQGSMLGFFGSVAILFAVVFICIKLFH